MFGINLEIKFGLNDFHDLELNEKEHSNVIAINPL